MVEFSIKTNKEQRLAYIPKRIFEVLTTRATAVPDRAAVLIFREGTSREDVLKSLDIIKADILHAQAMEQAAVANGAKVEAQK